MNPATNHCEVESIATNRNRENPQPLNAGIISMVFSTEEPFCENEIGRNKTQDPTLDRMLAVQTESMIAPTIAGAACAFVTGH